jgi:hypothetical protein
MPLKAALLRQDGKLLLQTGYNLNLVRLFGTLPKSECVYRDETRTWYIEPKHEAIVYGWLKKLNYLITEVDTPVPTSEDPYSVLGLLPTAVWEVCEAAYKALCRINHPDMGGNLEVMKHINVAWDKIKASKSK